jgi:hypothetical protein
MPTAYYDVELGAGILHLFAVDTQDTSGTQLNDMQARAAGSTAIWKLAFAHHPRYTSGDHQGDNALLDTITGFSPPSMYELQQAVYCHVDLFLSGHDHNREFIDKGQDAQCPSTYFAISGAGSKTRESAYGKVSSSLYYDEAVEGFMYFVVTPTQVTIESYDANPSDCSGSGAQPPAWSTVITK